MTPNDYLSILHCIAGLKERTRHAWMKSGRQESVAEHSWRMALMAYFLHDQFPAADLTRVLLMALLHDMGEVFTGDIPTFEKTDADRAREHELRDTWIDALPAPTALRYAPSLPKWTPWRQRKRGSSRHSTAWRPSLHTTSVTHPHGCRSSMSSSTPTG